MGKTSKRASQVSLTKVKPKGKELKSKLFSQVKSYLEVYQTVFVFTYENFKTNPLQQLRESFTSSKFLLGKSKVLQAALSQSQKKSIKELNKHMVGTCGLLFTNEKIEEIQEFFLTWRESASLMPGQNACESLTLNRGVGLFDRFANTIEPYLRKLGLATRVHNGKIELLSDFVVCQAGHPVTAEQSKVLRLLQNEQGSMKIDLKGVWSHDEYRALG